MSCQKGYPKEVAPGFPPLLGGVASLLAVWVEAVVAAPLWAFAHMDTEGEGVGQRAQTGYLFLLNVLFRPTLMVVGFVLGAMMCDILTDYVTALYPTIIANANVDSWTGLIKIVGYIVAFVMILQMVVNVSFQAIRYVPDQVLGWLGGNMQNQVGANASDEVGSKAAGAFAMRGSMQGPGMMAKAKQAKQAALDDNAKRQHLGGGGGDGVKGTEVADTGPGGKVK